MASENLTPSPHIIFQQLIFIRNNKAAAHDSTTFSRGRSAVAGQCALRITPGSLNRQGCRFISAVKRFLRLDIRRLRDPYPIGIAAYLAGYLARARAEITRSYRRARIVFRAPRSALFTRAPATFYSRAPSMRRSDSRDRYRTCTRARLLRRPRSYEREFYGLGVLSPLCCTVGMGCITFTCLYVCRRGR